MRACVRACMRVCVRECVCAYVRLCVCVCARARACLRECAYTSTPTVPETSCHVVYVSAEGFTWGINNLSQWEPIKPLRDSVVTVVIAC